MPTLLTSPYPQFNAGQRLVDTFELLEMILLLLPSVDVLLAQRTNRQFRSVVTRSGPLQLRLFLTTQPTTSASNSILLNPILTYDKVLQHIPLYFDEKALALAYCHREGRKRVYCTMATTATDEITREERVELQLTDTHAPFSVTRFGEIRTTPFGAGSWKWMCLSQPPCPIKWRLSLSIPDSSYEHR